MCFIKVHVKGFDLFNVVKEKHLNLTGMFPRAAYKYAFHLNDVEKPKRMCGIL
jgi:hypothetical protein